MSRERGIPATEVYNTKRQNDGGYGVGRWGEHRNDGRRREDYNHDSSKYQRNGSAQVGLEYAMIGVGENMTTIIVTPTVTVMSAIETVIVMVVMKIGVAKRTLVQLRVVLVKIRGVAMNTTTITGGSAVKIMEKEIAEATIEVPSSGTIIFSASSRDTTPEAMEIQTHMVIRTVMMQDIRIEVIETRRMMARGIKEWIGKILIMAQWNEIEDI
ncbi:hypothetical protein QAD02_002403 [Eretmocerus hayati]|uniref:Uncharacterized protein n=1 Tax=Eretmocerus hayati TaxID=131215 RepID=A0ACC2NJ45_9HYME|nr:hypothetical protein QAD02_002403 [Eretmocerus hayati]